MQVTVSQWRYCEGLSLRVVGMEEAKNICRNFVWRPLKESISEATWICVLGKSVARVEMEQDFFHRQVLFLKLPVTCWVNLSLFHRNTLPSSSGWVRRQRIPSKCCSVHTKPAGLVTQTTRIFVWFCLLLLFQLANIYWIYDDSGCVVTGLQAGKSQIRGSIPC